MRRPAWLLGAGAAAVLTLGVAAQPRAQSAPTQEVAVHMFQFQPDTLTVPAGTSVIWHNRDEIRHTVNAGTPERPQHWANLELAGRGSSVEARFPRAGIYVYHCGQHPSMRGAVRVTEPGEPS